MDDLQKLVGSVRSKLGTGSINIFGLPFAGKDTHGRDLAKILDGVLIGGGDIIRASNAEHVKAIIAKGTLAPKDEYLSMVVPYLSKEEFIGKPLLLSSVGRWHGEHEAIIDAAIQSGHPIKAVIYLKIDEQESIRRWMLADRGRHDDKELSILKNRFTEFNQKTIPVIEHYRNMGLLCEIDAMPTPQQVTIDLLHALDATMLV